MPDRFIDWDHKKCCSSDESQYAENNADVRNNNTCDGRYHKTDEKNLDPGQKMFMAKRKRISCNNNEADADTSLPRREKRPEKHLTRYRNTEVAHHPTKMESDHSYDGQASPSINKIVSLHTFLSVKSVKRKPDIIAITTTSDFQRRQPDLNW